MDKTDAINIIQQYAEVLRTKFDFQKIILFSSCVNGTTFAKSLQIRIWTEPRLRNVHK